LLALLTLRNERQAYEFGVASNGVMFILNFIKIHPKVSRNETCDKYGFEYSVQRKSNIYVLGSSLFNECVVDETIRISKILASSHRLIYWTAESRSRWPETRIPLTLQEFSDCSPWKRLKWRSVRAEERTVIITGHWPIYFYDARRHVSLAPLQ
jgi:hypothetical protein